MVQVIDDFLPALEFKGMSEKLLSTSWPWYFFPLIVHDEEVNDPIWFQFQHFFYNNHHWGETQDQFISSLTYRINPLAWIRIKMNLNPRTETPIKSALHTDGPPEVADFTTSIFYLNTTNGKTWFEDGTVVDNVANRLLTFNGHMKHGGISCTDQKRRVLINLNYIPYKTNLG
jgi:hypothetical protein